MSKEKLGRIIGYQPEKSPIENVTPPNTGSHVRPVTPFSCPVKVPKKGTSEHNDSILPQLEAELYAKSLESPWSDLPPTQQKIHEIMGAMKDLLHLLHDIVRLRRVKSDV